MNSRTPWHVQRLASTRVTILLALALCLAGRGGGSTETTTLDWLKNLPATLTGSPTLTLFSDSTPALGVLEARGESIYVIAESETLVEAGIRLQFGVEYRGEHTVTLAAAESKDPNIPRYLITHIDSP